MPVLESTIRRIRRSGANPAIETNSWWSSLPWSSSPSISGATVTDQSALSIPAFLRGVTLISRTLAGLPLQVFREEVAPDGAEGATTKIKTPDTAYLWLRPNPEQTRQTFWERVFADEVRGNAFIWVEKDDLSRPLNIWHIARRRMKVGRTEKLQKVYELDGYLPMIDYKDGGEIVHIPNWGEDIVGYDPVNIAAESIALGLSAQEYAARSLSQGSYPSGLLTSDMHLTPEQAKEVGARWDAAHAGIRNALKTAVLGSGAKFQQVSVDPEKMQLESLRQYQRGEIATLLGLPPFLLGDMDHASQGGGNGLEEQNRVLIQFNFQGHTNAVEQAVSDALLVRELTNRYMRFGFGGLLRGTTLQRYQALKLADFMTVNEKRSLEELDAVEGGDTILAMTNMVPLDELGQTAMNAPAISR